MVYFRVQQQAFPIQRPPFGYPLFLQLWLQSGVQTPKQSGPRSVNAAIASANTSIIFRIPFVIYIYIYIYCCFLHDRVRIFLCAIQLMVGTRSREEEIGFYPKR
jgi:hypothetical protein